MAVHVSGGISICIMLLGFQGPQAQAAQAVIDDRCRLPLTPVVNWVEDANEMQQPLQGGGYELDLCRPKYVGSCAHVDAAGPAGFAAYT